MTKLSDILKTAGLDSRYESMAISIIQSNSTYSKRLVQGGLFSGPAIEGNPAEVASFLKEEINKKLNEKFSDASTYTDDNSKLRKAYEEKRSNLPSGKSFYEYKTIIIKDSEILKTVDIEKIEITLNQLALEGWRLKAALTNEVGHNKAVVVNATINNTVLIMERLVTKE